MISLQQKTDDDDSGNDEPSDLPPVEGFVGLGSQLNSPSNGGDAQSPRAEPRPESIRIPILPLKIDRLAEQLSLLSTPRQPDSAAIVVDSLPAEGKLWFTHSHMKNKTKTKFQHYKFLR